ncbi:hypothetical protein [Meiothermus granaticius]|uniref:DUF3108 domain-containing protein n=1 Tax=Meiothermus granaticius NBRC 107808 TaxID=1227551 RepID=A0A399F583_9DEIN|nr:hypothetical protein [Meiothermus granaticius]MCL6525913.1 hypothetical protein [Thermaceae bacterium]RIH91927.1 hypothetical protein Mgrana_02202 [Meiothermus granaticius NBRC 107808]
MILGIWLLGALAQAQLCDQPFSPARAGWEWQYRISGEHNLTYSVRKTQLTDSGYVLLQQSPDRRQESRFRCTPEGIVPTDFGGGGITGRSGGDFDANIKILDVKGVQIPDYDTWVVGGGWKYVLTLGGTAQQGPLRFNVEGNIEADHRIVALEAITVPAGRFTAYKVQITTQFRVVGKAGPIGFPFNRTFESTAWYVEGVGLVKTVSGKDTTELLSLNKSARP